MEKSEYENVSGQDASPVGSIQGEGDYQAAREYRNDVETFLEHADVAKAARSAAPRNRKEALELRQAEEAGRSRARDPSFASDKGKSIASIGAVQDAIRKRPLVAMMVVAALGYLIGRIGERG